MYDVICMGSATIDLFLDINEKFKNCKSGEKILVTELMQRTGGGGTNVSVSLARLGLKVAFLGKVGQGHNTKKIVEELKREKVKIIKTTPSNLHSSFSVVMDSSKERDRIIYTYKGASNDLKCTDIKKKLKAKWLYIASLMGESLKTAEKVAYDMKAKGTKILFNPSEYLLKDPKKIKKIISITDILVLNKREAQILTKTKKDVKALYHELKKLGPKCIIITQGPKGAWYFDEKEQHYCKPKKVKVISTAGAGDAFTSGFLAGRIRTNNIKKSIQIATLNASSVVQHCGTKDLLLKWKDVK